jgi:hypothetical protein
MGRHLCRMPVPFGHMQCAVREALRGVQTVFNIRSLLTIVCLKVGEHDVGLNFKTMLVAAVALGSNGPGDIT